ncbi:ABC transporter substrate-binding protein [Gorillibacterium massiliense]|uniref:ABC transporter substrate-binding protein n=1 Tax=Gorillibacterium massiliense TaxID=1280390 RepID=UPI0004BAEAD2|nr:ABC transporter substrate-binding protein [Gorillibacterium massiliense]
MRGKTAKGLSMFLSAAMIMSIFAACGKSNDSKESASPAAGSSTAPSASTEASKAPAEDLTPIKFSFFSEDPNPNWNNMQDEVGKVLTEKTGVTLQAEFAVGDPQQKVALIASSGDYPDLISAKQDVSKLVDAGAVLDLTDLIDKYAPNIKKVLGDQISHARYSNEDKGIYAIPSYDGIGQKYFTAGGGFELQHAVVKELGYPKIRTVTDFENAIKAYKDKHPTVDGKPTIGLTLNADDWHMYISVTNPAFLATGGPDDGEYYINPQTYEAQYHFTRPEEKEYFKWLNHMNDIGLLDKESFTQKYDQYKAKIATGRVLGLIDQDWDYGDGEKALKAAGKFDLGYGHYPVTVSDKYEDHSFQSTGFSGGSGVSISKNCKDPVRAIKFLDYLASDEGQVLMFWGIEGKHYTVENGVRTVIPAVNDRKINDASNFAKESGIGNYNLLSAHYGDGVKDPSGNYYTTNFPEQIVAGYNDVEKEVLKAYGATNYGTWKDLFPSEDKFPVKPWGASWNIPISADSDLGVIEQKLKDITWKRIPEMIMAKPDQFDKLWDAYMAELDKSGVKKANELRTEAIKQRLELWK